MKAIILQRVIPDYRAAVFREITANENNDISLIIGQSIASAKAKNSNDLSGIKFKQLATNNICIFGRVFVWHVGLLKELRKENPDVIICEAESHFLGYLSAIIYKLFISPRTRLIMWCFYALPGKVHERSFFHSWVKKCARLCFDGFISYTSFGKKQLMASGISEDKITVAVNVCDTELLINKNKSLSITKEDAKRRLGVEDKFVVTYVGTVDEAKKPELVIELAMLFQSKAFHFFIIGSGPLERQIRARVAELRLRNITLTGRVVEDLPTYYRATDVVVIPGRGGIVISESMCFGVPVVVHQADGVEHDLIRHGVTGAILDSGDVSDFERELLAFADAPDRVKQLGQNAYLLVQNTFSTKLMANSVISSIERFKFDRKPK